jgi:hypothetical protein
MDELSVHQGARDARITARKSTPTWAAFRAVRSPAI